MAANSLYSAIGGRLVAYGPAPDRALQSAAIANNTVLFLGVAVAGHFAVVPYLYVRSSAAGACQIEDSGAVVMAGLTLAANVWQFVNLGGFGVMIGILGGDIGVRNLTGGLATFDITGAWQSA